MPDADWLAAYVVKMITVVDVIQEIAREQISERIDHVLWKKELDIVMSVKKLARKECLLRLNLMASLYLSKDMVKQNS